MQVILILFFSIRFLIAYDEQIVFASVENTNGRIQLLMLDLTRPSSTSLAGITKLILVETTVIFICYDLHEETHYCRPYTSSDGELKYAQNRNRH